MDVFQLLEFTTPERAPGSSRPPGFIQMAIRTVSSIRNEKVSLSPPNGAVLVHTPVAEPTQQLSVSFNRSQSNWKRRNRQYLGGSETSKRKGSRSPFTPTSAAPPPLCFYKSKKNPIFLPSGLSCFLITQEAVSEIEKWPLLPGNSPALPLIPENELFCLKPMQTLPYTGLEKEGTRGVAKVRGDWE